MFSSRDDRVTPTTTPSNVGLFSVCYGVLTGVTVLLVFPHHSWRDLFLLGLVAVIECILGYLMLRQSRETGAHQETPIGDHGLGVLESRSRIEEAGCQEARKLVRSRHQ